MGTEYIEAVRALCRRMGSAGYSLVFGGFSNGLMKAAADGFSAAGAEITGVTPASLTDMRDIHPACTAVISTDDLAERKKTMMDLADIFMVLPGGIGTFDEFFGVLAKKQIGESEKEVIIYNIDGFYDPLISYLDDISRSGFITAEISKLFTFYNNADEIMQHIEG